MQLQQSGQARKTLLENVNIDWNLSQDEAGSIDLSDEDTVIDNSTVNIKFPMILLISIDKIMLINTFQLHFD